MNEKIKNKLLEFFKTKKDLKEFLNTPMNDLTLYHLIFGIWIRNNILYKKSDFLEECEEIGVNADDLSNIMIDNFYFQLKYLDR